MATKRRADDDGAERREAPWERPAPKTKKGKSKAKSTKLSAAWKAKAKARAERAGRTYPNLVDNMWAAAEQKKAAGATKGDHET